MSLRSNQSGFTLVESIVALIVTSALIFIIIGFMTASIVQYAKTEMRSNLLNEAQIALDIISNDTRLSGNADEFNRWPDANAPGAPNDQLSWQSDNDTLILATAAEDSDGNIIFADPHLYISEKNNNVYFLDGTNLYKRSLASPIADNTATNTCPKEAVLEDCPADRHLLSNVRSLTIRYYNDQNQEVEPTDARSIEIQTVLGRMVYGSEVSVEYTTRMVFRND